MAALLRLLLVSVAIVACVVAQDSEGCPMDFFGLHDTNQCYKILDEFKSDWAGAGSRCREQELDLAQPPQGSVNQLRKFLWDRYGYLHDVWVGARRANPASPVLWQHQQNSEAGIPSNSPLWYPEFGPGGRHTVDDENCVSLVVNEIWLKDHRTTPYALWSCQDDDRFPLCQGINPDKEEEPEPSIDCNVPPVSDNISAWIQECLNN